MIFIQKSHHIKIAELWFNIPEDFESKRYSMCKFLNMYTPLALNGKMSVLDSHNAQTLLSDLRLTEDELLLRCESNVRNEIRRAKREGVICNTYTPQDLDENNSLIQQFDIAYKQMHQQKQMKEVSVNALMSSLAKKGCLYMSTSSIDNEVVAYHVYIAGDKITRLLYSVSVYRDFGDNGKRNAIGRANRLLHYNDMLYFKNMDFITYDWGGYATNIELASINAFKAGFGGELVKLYFSTITSHLSVKLCHRLLRFLKGKNKPV